LSCALQLSADRCLAVPLDATALNQNGSEAVPEYHVRHGSAAQGAVRASLLHCNVYHGRRDDGACWTQFELGFLDRSLRRRSCGSSKTWTIQRATTRFGKPNRCADLYRFANFSCRDRFHCSVFLNGLAAKGDLPHLLKYLEQRAREFVSILFANAPVRKRASCSPHVESLAAQSGSALALMFSRVCSAQSAATYRLLMSGPRRLLCWRGRTTSTRCVYALCIRSFLDAVRGSLQRFAGAHQSVAFLIR
jgi:hypothetical protein